MKKFFVTIRGGLALVVFGLAMIFGAIAAFLFLLSANIDGVFD